MARWRNATNLIVGLIVVAALGYSPQAFSAPPGTAIMEVREFEVLLKGKPTGTTKFTFEQFPDGRTVVTTDAVVRVNMIVFYYTYEFHGVETWVGDRLVSFQSHGSDGGKKFNVNGTINAANCQLEVNQKRTQGPAYAMTSNYWRVPLQAPRNQAFPAIDPSTGVSQSIRIGDEASARIPLENREIPATGYRLTGDVDVRLWLDAQGRIVRQQSVEQGYPTELRLTRIIRNDGATGRAPEFTADPRPAAGPAGVIRK